MVEVVFQPWTLTLVCRPSLAHRLPELSPLVEYQPVALGDVKDTFADRTHVEKTIAYKPSITFAEGLAREVDWAIARRNSGE